MIRKRKPSGNFTPISNDVFRDIRLNLTDRGLLATLMSLPENWDFSVSGMSRILPDGTDRIRSSLTRLEALGYISIKQERSPGGKYNRNQLIVNNHPDSPSSDFPTTDKQTADKRTTDHPAQYKNNNQKVSNIKNTDNVTGEFSGSSYQPKEKRIRKSSFFNFDQRIYPPEFYEELEAKLLSWPAPKNNDYGSPPG